MTRNRLLGRGRPKRAGTVATMTALLTPVIVGVSAIALDGGLMYLQRRQAQSIADASALAAAYAYYNTSNLTLAQTAAQSVASQYGVTLGATQVTSPQTGYMTVSLSTSNPRAFSAFWGRGALSVTASATARGISMSEPYSDCAVILLDPSSSGSLTIDGGADLTTTPSQLSAIAPVQVNSSSSSAVVVLNGAQVNATIDAVGGDSVAQGSHINGAINTGESAIPDPLASLPTPTIPPATSTPMSGYPGWGSYTLSPGLYVGDINLGNGGSFTMQPGIYYIQGGSLNVANGAILTGNGVMIYVDNGGGTINVAGGTTTVLTPPTSGTYSGMVYFQDRKSSVTPTISNGANITMSGTFYAAGAPMVFDGGSKTNQYSSQMIVKSMLLSDGADIDVPYSVNSVASKTSISVALVK